MPGTRPNPYEDEMLRERERKQVAVSAAWTYSHYLVSILESLGYKWDGSLSHLRELAEKIKKEKAK